MKNRIKQIIAQLTKDLYEREEAVSVSLLASLAGENVFLYGPPGVAKSLISRRLSKAFETKNYFEHLMNKFSTPEEVFGPVSIAELKKDNYVRKIDGFLPTADFAFLDEIWKSSPAILNTLLTIINERKFKNGNEVINVPLKSLISASNEVPSKNEGLEALYDRFLVRFQVLPLKNKKNFRTILQNGASSDEVEIKDKITNEELEKFKTEIEKVKISDDLFQIIEMTIAKIEEYNSKNEEKIYVSDRRWQKTAKLMKASACFNGRDETNISDSVLLMHCLWSSEEDKKILDEIIKDVIKHSSLSVAMPVSEVKSMLNGLEEEIKKELYYTDDIFDTVTLKDEKEYFEDRYIRKDNWDNKIKFEHKFYIPKEYYKIDNQFKPVDKNGNKIEWIRCDFKGTGSCEIKVNDDCRKNNWYCDKNDYFKFYHTYSPKVLYKKGERKRDVNSRLIRAFENEMEEIKKALSDNLREINAKKEKFLKEIDNPFVTEEKIKWCIDGIDNQINEIRLLEKECDRIKGLL